MLLSFKKFFCLSFFVIGITSCGFTPIAKVENANQDTEILLQNLSAEFQDKYYPLAEKRIYDKLKKKITSIYPAEIGDAQYIVLFKNFSNRSSGIRIDNDGNFTTYKMYASIEYEVRRKGEKEVVARDKLEVNTNYNIDDSIYVTEVVERETIDNLLDILISRLNSSFLLTIACN